MAREKRVASTGESFRRLAFDDFDICVGKSGADNDVLTFQASAPHDFWLHSAGMAGSHVVVRNPDERDELPRPILLQAAQLAAWYSKARTARGKVEVHCCQVRDVSKPRGFPPGQVKLRRWHSIRVYPKLAAHNATHDSE